MMKSLAPGKIILSGEHAVVYGKPALAMALNCFTHTSISSQDNPAASFTLDNYHSEFSIPLNQLFLMTESLNDKYQAFLAGNYAISDIFQYPAQLAQFTLGNILKYYQYQHSQGLHIKISSSIPLGCGMGSSAATTLSLIQALAYYFQFPLTPTEYFQLGCATEKLQHGYTSGIDVYISLLGGCIRFQQGVVVSRPLPNFPFYLINTGQPLTTTGECVTAVATQFKHDHKLWDQFETITQGIDVVLTQTDSDQQLFYNLIQENQDLLNYIGVVPAIVQSFIEELQERGGAGKICGGGAIKGQQGGIVLAVGISLQDLKQVTERYQFSILNFQGEANGIRVI